MTARNLLAILALVTFPGTGLAQSETGRQDKADPRHRDRGVAFFESKIRPLLVKHCYECHSAEAGAEEGGLRLDTREAIRGGGDRGPAVVPGDPSASLLWAAISHADSDLKMPPKQPRLAEARLSEVRKWIEMGAPDPRDDDPRDDGIDEEWNRVSEPDSFWAYQTPRRTMPPPVKRQGWPGDDLDRFVLARLTERGLTPNRDAAPEVLLRRLHFDLAGLPPTPEELDRFLERIDAAGFDQAWTDEVDRLLGSPAFGEVWARHWLDVARFGESSGKEANIPFPYAWRYRDYVIDSVGADLPINRFLTEQIAGDLLPYDTKRERARLLVATGFLAVGTKNLSEGNDKQFRADLIDEQIDSLTRGVVASSIACARCHDHKFDPFSMEDYYALAGIFGSTETYFGTYVSPASRQGGEVIWLPRLEDQVVLHPSMTKKRADEMKQQLAELRAEQAEMDASMRALISGEKPKKRFTLRQALANIWRRGPLVGKLQLIDERGLAVPVAMGVKDAEHVTDAPLLARGEVSQPGETVPRDLPDAISYRGEPTISDDESGRREFARWLTDPRHPLTARVFVNRVWHHLFGSGIVRTVDNFGSTGELPSHPELLDTLTVDFVEAGWSLKQLVRRLVLSRTYRQSSEFDREAFTRDPDNRLLWRMSKRRLPAEAIRDAMLDVSGQLDRSRPEGSLVGRVILDKPISLIGLDKRLPKDLDGSRHRSVYLPVIRDRLPDVLELFDFAEPSLVTGDRETTNVPLQALYLMNSRFVQRRASGFAERLSRWRAAGVSRHESHADARIVRAFRLCFSRPPDDKELEWAHEFLRDARAEMKSDSEEPSTAWAALCQALLATAEFRNID